MSDPTCFEVEVNDGVALVTLNRPDALNSMVPEFWTELPAIVEELDASGEVRCMVLASTGKHFSAGMDLSVFTGGGGIGQTDAKEAGRQAAHLYLLVQKLQASLSCLERARFPVLCAIQGGCVGGAVDLATAADCRYATRDAFFVVQEINIGMTADVGTLQRLPKLIPLGVAREWAYTGDRIPAERAREVGLVNQVFDDADTMLTEVMAIARRIAEKSPLAVWGSKEAITFTRDHSTTDALRQIATWQTGMFKPTDMMESFAAKAEKRAANFDPLAPRP